MILLVLRHYPVFWKNDVIKPFLFDPGTAWFFFDFFGVGPGEDFAGVVGNDNDRLFGVDITDFFGSSLPVAFDAETLGDSMATFVFAGSAVLVVAATLASIFAKNAVMGLGPFFGSMDSFPLNLTELMSVVTMCHANPSMLALAARSISWCTFGEGSLSHCFAKSISQTQTGIR